MVSEPGTIAHPITPRAQPTSKMCFLAWKTSDADESTGPMAPQTKLGALTIQACESVALRDVPINVSCEDTSAPSSWNSSIPYCL